MLHFKRATTSDATMIASLSKITFSQSHEVFIEDKNEFHAYVNKAFNMEQIQTELEDAHNFFWIAFKDGFPVGYSKLVIDSESEFIDDKNVCRLERIYVLNDFLHLKIGHQLQKIVFKKAIELKYHWIWLTVYIKNYRAINFYTKNNYKDVGTIDFSVGNISYKNTIFAKKLI